MTMLEKYQESIREIKRYLHLEFEYNKTTFVEKMTILASALFLSLILGVLCLCSMFYITYALATYLIGVFASAPIAFSVVAGVYLLLMVLVIIFRKSLITNPISKFLTKLFINP